MALNNKLDTQIILDGLGQGVLIFSNDGRLVMDNFAARNLLGADLNIIRSEGWSAATVLFNTRLRNPDDTLDIIRNQAMEAERPVRFHIYHSGEYVPCWAAAITGVGGNVYTMITLDLPDWTAVTEIVERFRIEMKETVDTTRGHANLIAATIKNVKPDETVESLGKRINTFTRLISIHMQRTSRLMEMLERLEYIRVGTVRETVRNQRKKIVLVDYFEDFVEELDEIQLLDPETEVHDLRSRVHTDVPDDLAVNAASRYLTRILHDLLRNAMMYSLKATPIKIVATKRNHSVQIEMVDEGYGVRKGEFEKVFSPFQRARQPQIISEFGYGLSLYLCKQEVETMNGRLWFESEEGVGSKFFLVLPLWRDESSSSSSQQDT